MRNPECRKLHRERRQKERQLLQDILFLVALLVMKPLQVFFDLVKAGRFNAVAQATTNNP